MINVSLVDIPLTKQFKRKSLRGIYFKYDFSLADSFDPTCVVKFNTFFLASEAICAIVSFQDATIRHGQAKVLV